MAAAPQRGLTRLTETIRRSFTPLPRRELRDPRGATQSLTYVSPGRPLTPNWNPDTAVRQAYLAVSTVYACVNVIANAVGSCPFLAGPDPRKPGSTEPKSTLSRLLGPPPGGPAKRVSARRLWMNSIAQKIVTGHFGWEIERNTVGDVVALWPLVSSALRPVPSQAGADWFDEFIYGRPTWAQRTPSADGAVRLRPDEILYDWTPSLSDFRQPESPLQAANLDVQVMWMLERYNYAFLRNDARPASLILTREFANADQFDSFKSEFLATFGTPDNAGKPLFAEVRGAGDGGVAQEIDVKTLGISQRDQQQDAIFDRVQQSICIALGVPFSMLDASNRTFSNGGIEAQNFWQARILPLLSEMADRINSDLAPQLDRGRYVGWFSYDHVAALRPPTKFQQVSPVDLVGADIVSRDEVRDELGLPPGDPVALKAPSAKLADAAAAAGVLVQAGYDPVGVLKAVGLPPIAMADKQPTPPTPPAPPPQPPPPAPDAPAPTRSDAHDRREFANREARRARVVAVVNSHVGVLEGQWERAFRRLFTRQRTATLDRLAGKRGRRLQRDDAQMRPDPSGVFDRRYWEAETVEIGAELLTSVAAMSGARIAGVFGADFSLEAPYVQAFVRSRANQLAGQVSQTTYDQITAALGDGLANGESIDAISQRVTAVFDEADATRATTIARTEVIGAYNGAAHEVATNLPEDITAGKEWISTHDGRTRDTHAEAGDAPPIDARAKFHVGGSMLDYPGDGSGPAEEVVNCRCTVGYLSPEEFAQALHIGGRSGTVEQRAAASMLLRLAAGQMTISDLTRQLAA